MNQIQNDLKTMSTTAPSPRVAFIAAEWHANIVEKSYEGFSAEFERLGHNIDTVETFTVPGAFDIPLQAKKLADSGRFEAIVAAGFIVDGGIYRHEFVSSAVIDGLMRVQLDTGTPVISCVLTPHQFQETDAHIKFFTEHFVIKGQEAARACAAIIENVRAI